MNSRKYGYGGLERDGYIRDNEQYQCDKAGKCHSQFQTVLDRDRASNDSPENRGRADTEFSFDPHPRARSAQIRFGRMLSGLVQAVPRPPASKCRDSRTRDMPTKHAACSLKSSGGRTDRLCSEIHSKTIHITAYLRSSFSLKPSVRS